MTKYVKKIENVQGCIMGLVPELRDMSCEESLGKLILMTLEDRRTGGYITIKMLRGIDSVFVRWDSGTWGGAAGR